MKRENIRFNRKQTPILPYRNTGANQACNQNRPNAVYLITGYTQHNTTQHNTTQHNTTQHNTTQHNTTQHNTTQHNTTQHKLQLYP
jgi:hypothetical protein